MSRMDCLLHFMCQDFPCETKADIASDRLVFNQNENNVITLREYHESAMRITDDFADPVVL